MCLMFTQICVRQFRNLTFNRKKKIWLIWWSLCITFPNKIAFFHSVELTRLPCPASDRLAPGSHSNAVYSLDPDLIFCPLLQVLNSKLSLQTVGNNMGEWMALWACTGVLNPVAHLLCIPIIFPFRQRLRGRRWCSHWEILDWLTGLFPSTHQVFLTVWHH